ncbi:flavin-containing monooxygenase [Nocardia nova]|uniref:flavin-containing monooxygenase n=1 Tax=Nocardia nova TaxID=37330 RepID=UPI0033EE12F1
MTPPDSSSEPDHEKLAQRYAQERAKRLGDAYRYRPLSREGQFARFARDMNARELPGREPVRAEIEVLIVGGGISGLVSAVELDRAGIADYALVEKGYDFGGTWYWNRYPGVRCDTEAYIYLPFLEETGYVPTERYTGGDEIRDYLRLLAEHFDIPRRSYLGTTVVDASWDNARMRWIVTTDRGDEWAARYLLLGGGAQHMMRFPDIPGLETFEGYSFHSSRWDHEYTGARLENLRDERVALIGTGATGVQIIPNLAESVSELYVVQRTPCAVDRRLDGPTDAEWFRSMPPGWQRARMESFEAVLRGEAPRPGLVGDQWTEIWGPPALTGVESREELEAADAAEDFAQMERIRRRIDETVDDPSVAALLKPYYYRRCKRATFNNDYLRAFNRPNVHLIDTDGRSVDKITARGFVVRGVEYEVDCIIYATGQVFQSAMYVSGEFPIRGRTGSLLTDEWEHGARSLHGTMVADFPNLMMVGSLVHSGPTINAILPILEQAAHVAHIISAATADGVTALEPTAEAEHRWCERVADLAPLVDESKTCTPGNKIHVVDGKPLAHVVYGGGPFEYFEILRDWRQRGSWSTDLRRIGQPERKLQDQ